MFVVTGGVFVTTGVVTTGAVTGVVTGAVTGVVTGVTTGVVTAGLEGEDVPQVPASPAAVAAALISSNVGTPADLDAASVPVAFATSLVASLLIVFLTFSVINFPGVFVVLALYP